MEHGLSFGFIRLADLLVMRALNKEAGDGHVLAVLTPLATGSSVV